MLRNRKRRIQRRLDPERGWSDEAEPIMKASNIHYEMAEKARAVNCGGIGAIHLMINKLGLRREIDSRLHLLKKHLPYPGFRRAQTNPVCQGAVAPRCSPRAAGLWGRVTPFRRRQPHLLNLSPN
jgi:hypothetical protein